MLIWFCVKSQKEVFCANEKIVWPSVGMEGFCFLLIPALGERGSSTLTTLVGRQNRGTGIRTVSGGGIDSLVDRRHHCDSDTRVHLVFSVDSARCCSALRKLRFRLPPHYDTGYRLRMFTPPHTSRGVDNCAGLFHRIIAHPTVLLKPVRLR